MSAFDIVDFEKYPVTVVYVQFSLQRHNAVELFLTLVQILETYCS